MAGLHPIVISALEHTHKSIKYTCTGEGLYKDGYLYDAHPPLPPKTAKTPKPGSESTKEVAKKPVAYWKAQCAFRGLNQTGAIADLQLRIRDAKKPMLQELKDAEKELNKEFRKKNKAARDGSWGSLKSAEQKAKADPKKFLTEVFPKGATGRPANLDIVVVKLGSNERLDLSEAAERMGLETVSVDAPWTGNKKPSPDRWIIVGRTRDAVWNQMREIEREATRSRQNMPKEKSKPKFKSAIQPVTKRPQLGDFISIPVARKSAPSVNYPDHTDSDDEPVNLGPASVLQQSKGFRTKQTARKSAPSKNYSDTDDKPETSRKIKPESSNNVKSENSFDVRGSWSISCEEIEGQWPVHDLMLDLYLQTKNNEHQLFGAFDFGIVKGVMRFEKPLPVPKSVKTEEGSKKRKRKEDEDVDMHDLDEYPGHPSHDNPPLSREKYDEKIFLLGAKDKPTARRPTWRYRWRGKDTNEGVIQLCSDEYANSITFSKKGTELSGTFKCDFIGNCRFTGVKVSSQPEDPHVDPEAQWVNHNVAAYHYANRARWG